MQKELWRDIKAKCIQKGISVSELASVIGIDSATLLRKGKGISEFNRNELKLLRDKLELTDDEFDTLFFA